MPIPEAGINQSDKNAVEASEQGSKIEVIVKRTSGYATIEVKDEGQACS